MQPITSNLHNQSTREARRKHIEDELHLADQIGVRITAQRIWTR
jgi:hypothetical protein